MAGALVTMEEEGKGVADLAGVAGWLAGCFVAVGSMQSSCIFVV